MKLSMFPPIFVILWCFSNYPPSVNSENALIYNWKFKKIDELKSDNEPCQYCITACPASSELEKNFDQNDSIVRIGNSLFLRETYPDVIYKKDMGVNICNTLVKPVMVWDQKEILHRIGYELYYNDKQKQQSFELKCDQYDEFRKIFDGIPSKKQLPSSESVSRHKDEDGINTVFEFQIDGLNQKLVFYWLPVLSIKSWISALIVHSKFNHRHITFEKDVMNIYPPKETIAECKDYNLGTDSQHASPLPQSDEEDEELEELKEIMELPSAPTNKPTMICQQSENECMKITQIMPMMFFYTTASKLATCTYLNLAYIWKSIVNGQLKKVDQYLYAMHRIWDSYDMKISFGITGEMELNEESVSAYTATVNLSKFETLRNFPTPVIMYRIVRYKLNSNVYQTIIVIHNDPNLALTPYQRVCSQKEEVEGWAKIKNQTESEHNEPGLTYACPVTANSLTRLGIYDHDAVSPSDPLELNTFPELVNGKIEMVDKTGDIEKELEYITDKLGIFK